MPLGGRPKRPPASHLNSRRDEPKHESFPPKLTTEDYYNFVDDKKVKRLSVNKLMREKLASGSLAIVRHGGGYEVIPREAALKIQERDPQRVVQLNIRTEEPDADDPYAAYQVPDDLMW